MTTKRRETNTPKKPLKRSPKAAHAQKKVERPVALTVKIDGTTYVRLSTLRAKQRRTAQDILAEALNAYLDQAGG